MKLIQIKQFTSENISYAMAAEIFFISAMERSGASILGALKIIDQYIYTHYDSYGVIVGSSNTPGNNGTYRESREISSVVIEFEAMPRHRVYVDNNGRAITYICSKAGDVKSALNNSNGESEYEYYDHDIYRHEYPCSPDQLMDVYMKYGFYSVDIIEKLKEMYPTIHYIVNE
jgi:hypothetical protein